MTRALYGLMMLLMASACTERLVCPAYQSAYIYDKDELRRKFSYFQEDSTPKIFASAGKTKYLIAEPTTYRKKVRSLQTVPMKKVFVEVPDSLSGVKSDSTVMSDLDRAARSVMDTTMVTDTQADTAAIPEESVYVITRDREVRLLKYDTPDSLVYDEVLGRYVPEKASYYVKEVGYNHEQDNYMWYLRHSLILPDVRIARMQQGKDDDKAKGKKGIGNFFKNLFGKDKASDIDSAELALPVQQTDEFDFIDTTATERPVERREMNNKRSRNRNEAEVLPDENPDQTQDRDRRKDETDGEPDQPTEAPKEDEDDGF